MASIIFLHGASSSGKTTIAKALQTQLDVPFWHWSIDHMRDAGIVPMSRYQNGDFNWQADRSAFFDGFHAALGAFASAGNNLIIEHILDEPRFLVEIEKQITSHHLLFVGVHVPLVTLIRREAARNDRPAGSAEQDFQTIHKGMCYDITVDGALPATLSARAILDAWKTNPDGIGFHQSVARAIPLHSES